MHMGPAQTVYVLTVFSDETWDASEFDAARDLHAANYTVSFESTLGNTGEKLALQFSRIFKVGTKIEWNYKAREWKQEQSNSVTQCSTIKLKFLEKMALQDMGDQYFRERLYNKAMKCYAISADPNMACVVANTIKYESDCDNAEKYLAYYILGKWGKQPEFYLKGIQLDCNRTECYFGLFEYLLSVHPPSEPVVSLTADQIKHFEQSGRKAYGDQSKPTVEQTITPPKPFNKYVSSLEFDKELLSLQATKKWKEIIVLYKEQRRLVPDNWFPLASLDRVATATYYAGDMRDCLSLFTELLTTHPEAINNWAHLVQNWNYAAKAILEKKIEAVSLPTHDPSRRVAVIFHYKSLPLTLDSFVACCNDRQLIGTWICVGIPENELPMYIAKYAGIKCVGSMIGVEKLLKELAVEYFFYFSQPWRFFVSLPYVTYSLALMKLHPEVGQVLLNRDGSSSIGELESPIKYQHADGLNYLISSETLRLLFKQEPACHRASVITDVGYFWNETDFVEKYWKAGFRVASLTVVSATTYEIVKEKPAIYCSIVRGAAQKIEDRDDADKEIPFPTFALHVKCWRLAVKNDKMTIISEAPFSHGDELPVKDIIIIDNWEHLHALSTTKTISTLAKGYAINSICAQVLLRKLQREGPKRELARLHLKICSSSR